MILNSISWWISNASDRYVVIYYCGIAVNGIYSVAYKIPAVLNVIGNIVGQAAGVSIVKNYDYEDKEGFFINTYRIYSMIITILCSLIILLTKFIAKYMFANEFYEAWKYVPFLLVSSGYGALSGHLGSVFSAKKEANKYAQSTLIGAAINIIVNFALVPFIGAMGAAIATCISYLIIWIIRVYHTRKFIKVRFSLVLDICPIVFLMVQSITINLLEGYKCIIIQLFSLSCIILLNITTIIKLLETKAFMRGEKNV